MENGKWKMENEKSVQPLTLPIPSAWYRPHDSVLHRCAGLTHTPDRRTHCRVTAPNCIRHTPLSLPLALALVLVLEASTLLLFSYYYILQPLLLYWQRAHLLNANTVHYSYLQKKRTTQQTPIFFTPYSDTYSIQLRCSPDQSSGLLDSHQWRDVHPRRW